MNEQECIEKIRAVYKIIGDYCNRKSSCEHCDFEKIFDDGSGACKFRLETGYAGWELFNMFKDEEENEL